MQYLGIFIENAQGGLPRRFVVWECIPLTLRQCCYGLDTFTTTQILLGIALGLEYIHSKNLMHVNLCLDTIFVCFSLLDLYASNCIPVTS